jgi:hypothetical protein
MSLVASPVLFDGKRIIEFDLLIKAKQSLHRHISARGAFVVSCDVGGNQSFWHCRLAKLELSNSTAISSSHLFQWEDRLLTTVRLPARTRGPPVCLNDNRAIAHPHFGRFGREIALCDTIY